jgi:hypothetical protein
LKKQGHVLAAMAAKCQNVTFFWQSWLPEHDLVLAAMAART